VSGGAQDRPTGTNWRPATRSGAPGLMRSIARDTVKHGAARSERAAPASRRARDAHVHCRNEPELRSINTGAPSPPGPATRHSDKEAFLGMAISRGEAVAYKQSDLMSQGQGERASWVGLRSVTAIALREGLGVDGRVVRCPRKSQCRVCVRGIGTRRWCRSGVRCDRACFS
jgi:hypothetical protein